MAGSRHLGTTDIIVERAVTVARPANELYRFWRALENLPSFMEEIEAVRPLEGGKYRWMGHSSTGSPLDWVVEILEEEPGRLLSWASAPGEETAAWGSVRFSSAPGGRGTEVHLALQVQPPASRGLAEWFWNLFGGSPGEQVQSDLRRFQRLMETGEIVRAGET